MNTWLWIRRVCTVSLILLFLASCTPPAATQPTGTPGVSGSGAGGNGSGGAGGSNDNSIPVAPTAIPTLEATPTLQPTPTINPTVVPTGPYLVRQTMTLADEVLGTPDGGVCTNTLFRIPAVTQGVSILFVFDPHGLYPGIQGNTFGYRYEISDTGETHAAEGSYTLTPNPDGSLKVSISANDHVTFKGFDGVIPVSYEFDLVPMGGDATCN